jgi:transposase InsO family protein
LPGEDPAPRQVKSTSKRYSAAEKRALLDELARSGETQSRFCARRGVSTMSMSTWRRALATQGDAALENKSSRGGRPIVHGKVRSPDERRLALEAFSKSGMSAEHFAKVWGISVHTLRKWRQRVAREGPKGLEPRRAGRPRGQGGSLTRLPAAVHEEIARTKQRFPDFGLKRVRDFLRRFRGVSVSTRTVARTLEERGIERMPVIVKRRAKRALPRRFERSRASELWQTDITSFVLTRSKLRVYLIAFVDDYSRFVVSHGLFAHQRAEIAIETLLSGIARFSKPKEVLSDQGRQYFAWRGKCEFQKLLVREGIQHVVARAHHPETLGKCERLWETINREFWTRVQPQDLFDARERLSHFIAHYNFFRPHQGIDGLVPADRFFGAEEGLRKQIESRISERELALALEEMPRTRAYGFLQIGDEEVSLSGERGKLVVHTSSGVHKEIGLDELGVPSEARKERCDGTSNGNRERADERIEREAASNGQEAIVLRGAGEDALGSARAVAACTERGADLGAPSVRADPLDVAGQEEPRGGGGEFIDSAAARVATEPASAERDAGGAFEATAQSSRPSECDAPGRRGSADLEEADRRAGERGA